MGPGRSWWCSGRLGLRLSSTGRPRADSARLAAARHQSRTAAPLGQSGRRQGGTGLTLDVENRLTAYGTALTAGYRGDGPRAGREGRRPPSPAPPMVSRWLSLSKPGVGRQGGGSVTAPVPGVVAPGDCRLLARAADRPHLPPGWRPVGNGVSPRGGRWRPDRAGRLAQRGRRRNGNAVSVAPRRGPFLMDVRGSRVVRPPAWGAAR